MTGLGTLPRAILAGVVAMLAVGLMLVVIPRAGAQTDPSNNAGISLVNRTGEGAHLWLGHSDAPNAWVVPGQSGYWWMTLKGARDFPGGPWNYNDKVRVNALRKGAPKEQTVTREFEVRGHVTNMRAIWDGSTLQFAADYGAGEGPSGAGATGSGGASTGGDGGLWPLSPEATVEALTASIVAIIMGIIASNLAVAGAAAAASAGGGEATTAPESPASGAVMDSGLRDPDSGDVVVAWEPGKYTAESGGKAGDVWYGGRWQSRDEATAQIQSTIDRKTDQEARNRQYEDEGRTRNQQLDQEAQARQRDADARARAERDQRNNDLGVAREEAKREVQKTIKAEMERNSAEAGRLKQAADLAGTAAMAGGVILAGADAGVDILGDHTGPIGKAINIGYTLTRTTAEKLAEGQSLRDAAGEGLSAVVVDQIKGKVVGAAGWNTHMDKRSFEAADAAVKTFMKTVTKPRTWTKKAVGNWALGEGLKVPIEKGFESLGLKKPDDA